MPDHHQNWHTDRKYEYDGAVWLPYFLDFVDDLMRNSNFGIGVLHVKVKYWRIFLWRHFSAHSSFYCFIELSILRDVYENKCFCDIAVP